MYKNNVQSGLLADQTFVVLTAHLGYLFGWSAGSTAACIAALLAQHESVDDLTADSISEIWGKLALRPFQLENQYSFTTAADLVRCWGLLATANGIPLDDLPTDWDRSLEHALFGMNCDPESSRADDLPKEVLELLEGPRVVYTDIMAKPSHPTIEGLEWRDSLAATLPQRIIMHTNGLLPTLELYLDSADIEWFKDISWRPNDLFLTAIYQTEIIEFGFVWEFNNRRRTFVAPLYGSHGKYSLALAMIFGMVRVDLYDTSKFPMPHILSRSLYVSIDACREFFNTGSMKNTMTNDILTPISEEFNAIDRTRHADAIASSLLLREAFPSAIVDKDALAKFDSDIDDWRASLRLGQAIERPVPPPASSSAYWPPPCPSDYLHPDEIFLHLEYDARRSELSFIWVDGENNFFEHYEVIGQTFLNNIGKHLEHRENGERAKNPSVVSDDGESTLRDVLSSIASPLENWWNEISSKPLKIWYSPGRQLSGVPLHFLLSAISKAECLRTPSLLLSAMVAQAVPRRYEKNSNLLDIFDCSAGDTRISSATKECRAIRDCYRLYLPKHTSEEFLQSQADVIHVSAHGKGFGNLADNQLLLGPSGEETVDVIDILRSEGVSQAELIFLDVCSVGSANNARTALHEGLSVADALLLRGASHVVAAEWPIGDLYGALYSTAFHMTYTQNHSVAESLHIVRSFFQETLDYPDMEWLIDGILERTYGDWRSQIEKLSTKPDHFGYIAAFEVHGRPQRIKEKEESSPDPISSLIAWNRRASKYIDSTL
ncbi:hypothetical protein AC20117_14940 [Arthrobacter crystallopoietes]|nr:hypothetical protein AC20117_14940 [Arthrobacter crystallopoietes]